MDSGVLQDTLKWLGQLPPVKGAVAGAIALLTPIAGVVAKEAVTAWMRDRARKQESAKMDDEHAPVGREDTAVVALRRITADAQRDAECARVALEMSERESKHLRERVADLERELASTASDLAAKTYALESVRTKLAWSEKRREELSEENRAILSGHTRPVTEEPPDLRTSQRPTPVSGLHGVVPAVVVPKLPPLRGKIGPDDVTPPKPRPLPKR